MLFRTLAWYGGVPRRHCGRQRAPGVWSTRTISKGSPQRTQQSTSFLWRGRARGHYMNRALKNGIDLEMAKESRYLSNATPNTGFEIIPGVSQATSC